MDHIFKLIMSIMSRYEEYISTKDENEIEELAYIGAKEIPFSLEEQAIIQLYEADNSKHYKDKIEMLESKLEELESNLEKRSDCVNSLCDTIAKLEEHIDVLENNPFRRIYNSIAKVFKYRIKLVKKDEDQSISIQDAEDILHEYYGEGFTKRGNTNG